MKLLVPTSGLERDIASQFAKLDLRLVLSARDRRKITVNVVPERPLNNEPTTINVF